MEADAAYWCGNVDAPFIKAIKLWEEGDDPDTDDATYVHGRVHYSSEYQEKDRAQGVSETAVCMISMDQVVSVDRRGVLEIANARYKIRDVSNVGGSWAVTAERWIPGIRGSRDARFTQ